MRKSEGCPMDAAKKKEKKSCVRGQFTLFVPREVSGQTQGQPVDSSLEYSPPTT
jgi:hypothetical protein